MYVEYLWVRNQTLHKIMESGKYLPDNIFKTLSKILMDFYQNVERFSLSTIITAYRAVSGWVFPKLSTLTLAVLWQVFGPARKSHRKTAKVGWLVEGSTKLPSYKCCKIVTMLVKD